MTYFTHKIPWIAAIASGLLASCAFPPLKATWLCWIAWTPLIITLWWGKQQLLQPQEATKRFKKILGHPLLRFFLLGYLAGISFFWSSLFWLREVTIGGWILLGLYLGIYPALWALFVGTVGNPQKKKGPEEESLWLHSGNNLYLGLVSAAAWVGLEWIRGFLFTGFGWNAQGVALYENIPLIQIADITGVYGLSFLIILANLVIVMAAKRFTLELRKYGLRPHFDLTLTLALIAGAFLYGAREVFHFRENNSSNNIPLRIACIQAAIPQSLKWDPAFDEEILQTYQKHSQLALQLQPHLLIWPEAATPHPALLDARDLAVVKGVAQSFSGDLLIGTVHFTEDSSFNSAVLFSNQGEKTQLYSKIHLVPFGEYIPLRYSFPLFAWAVGTLIPSDFTPGPQPVVFSLHSSSPLLLASSSASSLSSPVLRVAPLICFEDTLGSLARLFVLQKANFFAVITNDGWFKKTSGSEQHLANAVFRSVEFKLPMVRCANTGVTCFINQFGAVTRKFHSPEEGTFGAGILVDELLVPLYPPFTFYARFGDIFSLCALAFSCLMTVAYLVNSKEHIIEELFTNKYKR